MKVKGYAYGVGINDAGYSVMKVVDGVSFKCPFYRAWFDMMKRCYSKRYQAKRPSYIGCSVSTEWLTFSNFRLWMSTQDWEGKALDKDLLVPGNKVYSSGTCLFVSMEVNNLLTNHARARGKYPQGVYLHSGGKFAAQVSINGSNVRLGYYKAVEDAESAYISAKRSNILRVASSQEPILMSALIRVAESM